MDGSSTSGNLPTVNQPAPSPPPARRHPSVTLPRPRRSVWGLIGAVLFHALVLGAIGYSRWRELLTWEAIQPGGAGDADRAVGGGGGGVRVVAIPAWREPTSAAVPAPTQTPLPTPLPTPVPQLEPVPPAAAVGDSAADSVRAGASPGLGGTGTGGGLGSGTGPGKGSGIGPGTGSGTGGGPGGGSGARPPEPRQLILPPLDYPEGLRGRSIAVTFWVNTDGRVERVALEPEIEDRGFQRRFVSVMRSYRFRPARSTEGSPIPGTTTITITF